MTGPHSTLCDPLARWTAPGGRHACTAQSPVRPRQGRARVQSSRSRDRAGERVRFAPRATAPERHACGSNRTDDARGAGICRSSAVRDVLSSRPPRRRAENPPSRNADGDRLRSCARGSSSRASSNGAWPATCTIGVQEVYMMKKLIVPCLLAMGLLGACHAGVRAGSVKAGAGVTTR